jgi:hypothetical protein
MSEEPMRDRPGGTVRSIDALFQTAKAVSRDIAEREELIPVILTMDHEGAVGIITIGSINESVKQSFIPVVSAVLKRVNAQAYVFVNEAFMSSSSRAASGEVQVSDLPPDDRDEIVLLTGKEKGCTMRSSYAVIDHKPAGRRLREWVDVPTGATLEGRMVVTEW